MCLLSTLRTIDAEQVSSLLGSGASPVPDRARAGSRSLAAWFACKKLGYEIRPLGATSRPGIGAEGDRVPSCGPATGQQEDNYALRGAQLARPGGCAARP